MSDQEIHLIYEINSTIIYKTKVLEKTPKIVEEVIKVTYSKWRHQFYSAPHVKWNFCETKWDGPGLERSGLPKLILLLRGTVMQ